MRFAVIPPDMHHQKALQFLQILQIGLAVAGKTLISLPSVSRRDPASPWGSPTLRYYRSGLSLSSEGWGGHENQLAEAFIGHTAEDALVQPGRLAGGGHNGG